MSGACSEACGEVVLCYITLCLCPWEEGSCLGCGVARGVVCVSASGYEGGYCKARDTNC